MSKDDAEVVRLLKERDFLKQEWIKEREKVKDAYTEAVKK